MKTATLVVKGEESDNKILLNNLDGYFWYELRPKGFALKYDSVNELEDSLFQCFQPLNKEGEEISISEDRHKLIYRTAEAVWE